MICIKDSDSDYCKSLMGSKLNKGPCSKTDRQTDRQTNKQTDRQTDRQPNRYDSNTFLVELTKGHVKLQLFIYYDTKTRYFCKTDHKMATKN